MGLSNLSCACCSLCFSSSEELGEGEGGGDVEDGPAEDELCCVDAGGACDVAADDDEEDPAVCCCC